jgi:hypothetical protein
MLLIEPDDEWLVSGRSSAPSRWRSSVRREEVLPALLMAS